MTEGQHEEILNYKMIISVFKKIYFTINIYIYILGSLATLWVKEHILGINEGQ